MFHQRRYLALVSLAGEMAGGGVALDLRGFNMLICAYVNLGCFPHAFSVFGGMLKRGCSPDVVTYNTLSKGLSMSGGTIGLAVAFLKKLVQLGCPRDVVTYNVLIKGLCRVGAKNDALSLLRKMGDIGASCRPNVVSYSIVVDGCAKMGVWMMHCKCSRKWLREG